MRATIAMGCALLTCGMAAAPAPAEAQSQGRSPTLARAQSDAKAKGIARESAPTAPESMPSRQTQPEAIEDEEEVQPSRPVVLGGSITESGLRVGTPFWLDETAPFRVHPFFVAGAGGKRRLEVGGRVHADARVGGDRTRVGFEDDVGLRRMRVEVRGQWDDWLEGMAAFEFGDYVEGFDIRNAFLLARLSKSLQLRAGRYLLPFSDVSLMSSNVLSHPERPVLVGAIARDRGLGAHLGGWVLGGHLGYTAGVSFASTGTLEAETERGVDLTGRVELWPYGGLSLSASYILTPSASNRPGPKTLRTLGGTFTPVLRYASANRARGPRNRVGFGARWVEGPFAVGAEWMVDSFESVSNPEGYRSALHTHGWYVDFNWVITGEPLRPGSGGIEVIPADQLYDPRGGTFGTGAWTLALRYEELWSDRRAVSRGFATGSDTLRAFTATVNWAMWRSVRFAASYTLTMLDRPFDGVAHGRAEREHAALFRFMIYF